MSSTQPKRSTRLLLAAFVAVLLLAVNALAPAPRQALAQSGDVERLACGSFSVSSIGVVVTATSTTAKITLKEVYLTSATAGLVTFHDGTTGGDATRVGKVNVYLAANTPTALPPNLVRDITVTSAGNSLQCIGPGVLIFDIKYTSR